MLKLVLSVFFIISLASTPIKANAQNIYKKAEIHCFDKDSVFYCETYSKKPITGIVRDYSKYGLYSEEHYKDGHRDGVQKYYYPTGKISREINYKNGIINGIAKEYYESSGKLKIKADWSNFKQNGTVSLYDEDGTLTDKIKYINGRKKFQPIRRR